LVNIDVTRERVLLSGESNVNQALQPCLVKRKLADFKPLALAASAYTEKRSQGSISRLLN
jgi:hypothetical protein